MLADGVLKSAAALMKFLADFSFTLENEQGMSEGVVANDVAGLDEGASDFGMLANVQSDQKKSGVDVMFGEDFEELQSVGGVGAVIVGEGELAGGARQSGKSLAIPLAGRRHGLVTGGYGGRSGDGAGEGEGEHVGIVFH